MATGSKNSVYVKNAQVYFKSSHFVETVFKLS